MTLERPGSSTCQPRPERGVPRRGARRGPYSIAIAIAFTALAPFSAPSAAADTTASLREAVAAARGSSCDALRYDPMIEQAAEEINVTTSKWIDNAARSLPESDALPLLKDRGYRGNKAAILSGASSIDANAIKGLLLEGYAKIPDCSYTDYGVNAQYNAKKDLILTTVVLAG